MSRRTAARLSLGSVLVLHGLANAVLPLRGVHASGLGLVSPTVTLLQVAAIIGFVGSGLGVLRVAGLRRLTIPLSGVAAIAAIAAQVASGAPDLWVGLVLSALLPLLVALQADRDGDDEARARRLARVRNVAGLALFAWVATSALAWPWHRSWGATPDDWALSLPGDHVPRTPALEILHAVDIAAPPEAVWPWLAQLGQDRGGFYSYSWLEHAVGADIHNADRIHPEWQVRQRGERVYATQAGYLGGLLGERPGWTIDEFSPGRALVLRHWGAFVLVPTTDGGTRLLVRSTISNERIPAWAAALNFGAFELPHFIMQRRMLLGIKSRAERIRPRFEPGARVHDAATRDSGSRRLF